MTAVMTVGELNTIGDTTLFFLSCLFNQQVYRLVEQAENWYLWQIQTIMQAYSIVSEFWPHSFIIIWWKNMWKGSLRIFQSLCVEFLPSGTWQLCAANIQVWWQQCHRTTQQWWHITIIEGALINTQCTCQSLPLRSDNISVWVTEIYLCVLWVFHFCSVSPVDCLGAGTHMQTEISPFKDRFCMNKAITMHSVYYFLATSKGSEHKLNTNWTWWKMCLVND